LYEEEFGPYRTNTPFLVLYFASLIKSGKKVLNPHASKAVYLLLLREQKRHLTVLILVFAEKRGFEPPRALTPYLLSKEAQSTTLTLLQCFISEVLRAYQKKHFFQKV
jgi:hypothetical protein